MENKALLGMGEKGAKKIIDAVKAGQKPDLADAGISMVKGLNEGEAHVEEEEMVVHVTDTGIEYTEHEYVKKGTEESEKVRLFRSLKSYRLKDEGETHVEYTFRRKVAASALKEKKKGTLAWRSVIW